MIRSIHQALLITKRNDILAVVAGNRVHDGGGYDDRQQKDYENSIAGHNACNSTLFAVAVQELKSAGLKSAERCLHRVYLFIGAVYKVICYVSLAPCPPFPIPAPSKSHRSPDR